MLIVVVCIVFVALCALVYFLFNDSITLIRQEKPLRKLEANDYLYRVTSNGGSPLMYREKIRKIEYNIQNSNVQKVSFYLYGKKYPIDWDLSDEYRTGYHYSSYGKARERYNEIMGEKYMADFKEKVEIGARDRIINDFKNGNDNNNI